MDEPSPMTVTVERPGAGVLIRLVGEGNIHAVQAMNDGFHPVVAEHSKVVVLDLAGVPVMGSLAMGALITLRKALRRNGGELYVAGARPLVLDAFARTRLAEVLNLRDSVESALAEGAGAASGAGSSIGIDLG